jgi:hypothetical protein
MSSRRLCGICGNSGHNAKTCKEENYFSDKWHCPLCMKIKYRDPRKGARTLSWGVKYDNERIGKHRIFQCPYVTKEQKNGQSSVLDVFNMVNMLKSEGIGVGSIIQISSPSGTNVLVTTPNTLVEQCIHEGITSLEVRMQTLDNAIAYGTIKDVLQYKVKPSWKWRTYTVVDKSDVPYYIPQRWTDRHEFESDVRHYMGKSEAMWQSIMQDRYCMDEKIALHRAFCSRYGIKDVSISSEAREK